MRPLYPEVGPVTPEKEEAATQHIPRLVASVWSVALRGIQGVLSILGICALGYVRPGRSGTRTGPLECAWSVLVTRDRAIGTDKESPIVQGETHPMKKRLLLLAALLGVGL